VETLPVGTVSLTLTFGGIASAVIVDGLPSSTYSDEFRPAFATLVGVDDSQVRIQSMADVPPLKFSVAVAVLPSVVGEAVDPERVAAVVTSGALIAGHAVISVGAVSVESPEVVPDPPPPPPAEGGGGGGPPPVLVSRI